MMIVTFLSSPGAHKIATYVDLHRVVGQCLMQGFLGMLGFKIVLSSSFSLFIHDLTFHCQVFIVI